MALVFDEIITDFMISNVFYYRYKFNIQNFNVTIPIVFEADRVDSASYRRALTVKPIDFLR